MSSDFTAARNEMVRLVSAEVRDRRVLDIMSRVPRELFVPRELRFAAYQNIPLPIGYEQTISQPLIVGLMTEALELNDSDKVLEVGTGSGYQAAILGEIADFVITVERIPSLAESARRALENLGYHNIQVQLAGDSLGWPAGAPYDAIMVTAASPSIPEELVAQLEIGGRMVIPVGSRYNQELIKITRLKDKNHVQNLGGCRFVCLIGRGAWENQEV